MLSYILYENANEPTIMGLHIFQLVSLRSELRTGRLKFQNLHCHTELDGKDEQMLIYFTTIIEGRVIHTGMKLTVAEQNLRFTEYLLIHIRMMFLKNFIRSLLVTCHGTLIFYLKYFNFFIFVWFSLFQLGSVLVSTSRLNQLVLELCSDLCSVFSLQISEVQVLHLLPNEIDSTYHLKLEGMLYSVFCILDPA